MGLFLINRRKHYLCISAPAMPLPPPLPEPGPGSYELVDYKGPAKHYMSSAAFVSSTSRWTGGEALTAPKPGPGKNQTRDKQGYLVIPNKACYSESLN